MDNLHFLLNNILTNVMNTVSELVSVCLLERNISVPAYFGVPFQSVLELRYFIIKNIYILLIKKKKPI